MSNETSDAISLGQDGKRKLCFGYLPGRKRPCVYFWDPLDIHVLGNLKDESALRSVTSFIDGMVGARIVSDEKGAEG